MTEMNKQEKTSPLFIARAGGVFWLMTILTGVLALVLGGTTVVSGDAAVTASRILALESSYRLTLVVNVLAGVCYVGATVFVYALLKPVSRHVSMLAALFSILGCAGGTVAGVLHLAPLALLKGSPSLSVFTPAQLQALALMFLKFTAYASNINFLFFGLHCLLVGSLILRSTFLPRIVGALMVLGGLGWITNSLTSLLAPSLARLISTYGMAAGGLGEVSLTLWLLIMGVNVSRWTEQAGASRK